MVNTKCYYEENRPLLVLALDPEKCRISDPTMCAEAAIARGAVNHLGKWPAHVLAAFVAGCLIFSTFIFFGIISTILIVPTGARFRTFRDFDANDRPNIYFVKYENRTWNPNELCYIETTARTYKNLSIYLINLLADNKTEGNLNKLLLQLLDNKNRAKYNELTSKSLNDLNEEYKSVMNKIGVISNEIRVRENLAIFNPNIKNIDVSTGRFFNGSRLEEVYKHLDREIIEMAARVYVLWNFPGVAVDPSIRPKFKFFHDYLCSKNNVDDCKRGRNSTSVEINGNIQASSVPCQVFLDYLMNQISMNEFSDKKRTLIKATSDFCGERSSSQCRGVRLLNDIEKADFLEDEKFDCPTIFAEEKNV